jgi:hypothetical protein
MRRLEAAVDRATKPTGKAGEILRRKPEKPSALEKFDKLAERNSFMGGGIGMAIAAYAFLLGGAPRFGFVLLVVSWLVIAISVWRHRFFENRRHENMWNIVVCGLTGILLFGIWILLV